MFNFLTVLFDRSHIEKKWDAPNHWYQNGKMSTHERQEREADRHRMFLIRERNGMW